MLNILMIITGGAIGAVLRYRVYISFSKSGYRSDIITSTVLVNILGCFIAGVFLYLIQSGHIESSEFISFIGIGLLGSFTTFSAFSLEALKIMQTDLKKGILYLFVQFITAIAGVAVGFEFMRFLL